MTRRQRLPLAAVSPEYHKWTCWSMDGVFFPSLKLNKFEDPHDMFPYYAWNDAFPTVSGNLRFHWLSGWGRIPQKNGNPVTWMFTSMHTEYFVHCLNFIRSIEQQRRDTFLEITVGTIYLKSALQFSYVYCFYRPFSWTFKAGILFSNLRCIYRTRGSKMALSQCCPKKTKKTALKRTQWI